MMLIFMQRYKYFFKNYPYLCMKQLGTMNDKPTYSPFARPLYVMLKPAGPACNLACEYCYYLEKKKLQQGAQEHCGTRVQDNSQGHQGSSQISNSLLETFTRQYIEAQTQAEVLFTWHGGEPLLQPISFYKEALKLQRRYARGRHIDNCLQTNGTLLTDEWCRFFKEHNFLIGISIDGPKEFHDHYRHTRNGQPSFDRVMRGIRLLQKHGVEWNAMAVVNSLNVEHPREFYRFFRDLGCQFLQFTPIVERTVTRSDGLTLAPGMSEEGTLTDFSVTPEQWGRFLCEVYDEWVQKDVGTIYVQMFDATLANWVGVMPGLCSLSKTCGHAAVMESNGDVYACDHFVFPEYRLGNILHEPITAMMYGEKQQAFARIKQSSLPRQCKECRFLFACHGECPKNRFLQDRYGEPFLNYLCAGYHQFFTHVASDMDFMASELRHQRPPANIMVQRTNVCSCRTGRSECQY